MPRVAYVITAYLVLTVLPQLAYAGWEVGRQKDEMTDEVTLFASTANKNAQLYLHEDWRGYVGTFRINPGNFKQIHYTPKVIVIRVDKNPAHTVEFYGWEPKLVFFSLDKKLVKEMANGTLVKIRYPEGKHTHEIEIFTLKGADQAFRAVLPSYTKKSQPNDPDTQKHAEQLSKYNALIRSQVNRNWNRPASVAKGLKCVVSVRLAPSGEVLSASVVHSSGNVVFDHSVENAVYKAVPLPLPQDQTSFDDFREIEFLFSPDE